MSGSRTVVGVQIGAIFLRPKDLLVIDLGMRVAIVVIVYLVRRTLLGAKVGEGGLSQTGNALAPVRAGYIRRHMLALRDAGATVKIALHTRRTLRVMFPV